MENEIILTSNWIDDFHRVKVLLWCIEMMTIESESSNIDQGNIKLCVVYKNRSLVQHSRFFYVIHKKNCSGP